MTSSEKKKVVILLGPPGAGKGTQAVRLAAECALPHISTGDLFRENVGRGTELGTKAKEFMNSGKLVPDELVLDMLFDRVGREDCRAGYVLDGFPRTEAQATALEAKLTKSAEVLVPCLDISEEAIVRRASGRLLCRECGNIQHLEFKPPAVKGICDACGGELFQRDDDKPEVVLERLQVYHAETAPLVDFYETRGLLRHVDVERTPEAVFDDLVEIVRPGEET